MLWHIVKFYFDPNVSEEDRRASEDEARGLGTEVDAVRFLRMARSVDEPEVTGLVVGFDDEAGMAAYNEHPAHGPVAERIDGRCSQVVRLDMITDDDPAAFPS